MVRLVTRSEGYLLTSQVQPHPAWRVWRCIQRLTPVAHHYWKFGGGTKPPNSRSISAANLIVV